MYLQGNSCLIWRLKPLGVNVVKKIVTVIRISCACFQDELDLVSERSCKSQKTTERTRNSTREEELLN